MLHAMKNNMKKTPFSVALAFVALVAMAAAPAIMTVTFDPDTGTGFVGKGDVQLALGYNNAQLQAQAEYLQFTYNKTSEQETTWECYNENNGHTQERSRTSTSTTSGVVSSVARVRNQITGFNLTGFGSSSSTSTTDGPPLNSCPNANSSFVLGTTFVGEEVVTGGGLSVNGVQIW